MSMMLPVACCLYFGSVCECVSEMAVLGGHALAFVVGVVCASGG